MTQACSALGVILENVESRLLHHLLTPGIIGIYLLNIMAHEIIDSHLMYINYVQVKAFLMFIQF